MNQSGLLVSVKNLIAHKIYFESMTMDLVGAPVWSEQCASPKNQAYYGSNVTSPTNSDNNFYGSPAVSPGNWNPSSPYDAPTTPTQVLIVASRAAPMEAPHPQLLCLFPCCQQMIMNLSSPLNLVRNISRNGSLMPRV